MSKLAASTPALLRSRATAQALLVAALAVVLAAPPAARADGERVQEIAYDTPGSIPLLSPTYDQQSREVVLITDDRLSPRRVTVEPGQQLVWVSYAGGLLRITFEREVAKSMVCHSLVNFHLEEDELRSGLLQTGDVASFCELAPGSYRYRVVPEAPHDERDISNRLRGLIVVPGGDGTG